MSSGTQNDKVRSRTLYKKYSTFITMFGSSSQQQKNDVCSRDIYSNARDTDSLVLEKIDMITEWYKELGSLFYTFIMQFGYFLNFEFKTLSQGSWSWDERLTIKDI